MKVPSSYIRSGSSVSNSETMTPMIDVVFQLLIFFVWTSSFQVIEQVLPSSLSAATGKQQSELEQPPPEADFDQVVIRIGWDGSMPSFRINDAPVPSLAEIRSSLERLHAVKQDATVILHPDPAVPLEHVINCYDQAKQVRFEKVSFAVNPRRAP
ncbi:MAG: ExbD/TolR family protein [Planctomycetota bacterium]|jgi:biopolymer transport protein ExbD|nr:biopolymer transporter ExbD [Blastopirellula sp.]